MTLKDIDRCRLLTFARQVLPSNSRYCHVASLMPRSHGARRDQCCKNGKNGQEPHPAFSFMNE
jgi:hypothetical protein